MCTQQHAQTTLHRLSLWISFISEHQRCCYPCYCIDPTNLAASMACVELKTQPATPGGAKSKTMSVICVYSCDTTELLASVVSQSLRVHNKTRSAALLIQSLAGGMRPQSALLLLSLLLLILIYSSCEHCGVAHWLVASDSDASQLRRLSSSAQRGWDQWSTERNTTRWAREIRRDVPEEMKMALCAFVCFLAVPHLDLVWTFLSWVQLSFIYLSCSGQNHFPGCLVCHLVCCVLFYFMSCILCFQIRVWLLSPALSCAGCPFAFNLQIPFCFQPAVFCFH